MAELIVWLKKPKTRSALARIGKTLFQYAMLTALAVVFFVPLLWMVSTSLKPNSGLLTRPIQWFPETPLWSNYGRVFARINLLRYFGNTLIVSLMPVLGQLLSAPIVAYSITKVPWKGGKVIFPIILATMMIPWQVTQIPLYIIWNKLGFVNTFVPLVLPAFFGAPYYIYLMRQFIKGLPDSIMEASRIDGASEVMILYRIAYPLCVPVMTTIGVLVFIAGWNDLNAPLIYLQDSLKYTLSVGLKSFILSAKTEWELLMAANTMFTLPLIIIFFCAQKMFLSGISTTSGLK